MHGSHEFIVFIFQPRLLQLNVLHTLHNASAYVIMVAFFVETEHILVEQIWKNGRSAVRATSSFRTGILKWTSQPDYSLYVSIICDTTKIFGMLAGKLSFLFLFDFNQHINNNNIYIKHHKPQNKE